MSEDPSRDWESRLEQGGPGRALSRGHPDCVNIIVQQPDIDYNIKDAKGNTLAHAAVIEAVLHECLEILAAQERFDFWNIPNDAGDIPIMWALSKDYSYILEIIGGCPRVDLNCIYRNGRHLEDDAR